MLFHGPINAPGDEALHGNAGDETAEHAGLGGRIARLGQLDVELPRDAKAVYDDRLAREDVDLPLRVLVREDADGRTQVSFHPVVRMLLATGVPEALATRLEPAQALLLRVETLF